LKAVPLVERRKYLNVPDEKWSILNSILGMRMENTRAGRRKSGIEIFINFTKEKEKKYMARRRKKEH
jgi:hypothetical protein